MTRLHNEDLILVPLGPAGTFETPIARVHRFGAGRPAADEPVFACATIGEAETDRLEEALREGITGIVLCGGPRTREVEQLSGRLAAAEAVVGRDDGATSILVMIDTPGSASAVADLGRVTPRLTGIGIDTGAVADTMAIDRVPPYGAAITVARGSTVLAAAAAGVPAFERTPGPATSQMLAACVADGFAWALLADRRLTQV